MTLRKKLLHFIRSPAKAQRRQSWFVVGFGRCCVEKRRLYGLIARRDTTFFGFTIYKGESMSEGSVQFKEVPYFAMSEDCDYSFIDPLGLNVMELDEDEGFITVCRGYDEYFIGRGKTREEAAYDWKAKFHCFFQRFMIFGPSTDEEEKLYRLMRDNIDMDVYERNLTTNRVVVGTIEDCRFYDQCPRSYRLDGSDGVYEIPPYEYVDKSFMLLKKGDRFRGIFEYQNRDYKLIRILYATRIPKDDWE